MNSNLWFVFVASGILTIIVGVVGTNLFKAEIPEPIVIVSWLEHDPLRLDVQGYLLCKDIDDKIWKLVERSE